MVPLRYVFRSRWWALAWAAGICWSAAQFARSQHHEAATNASNASAEANSDEMNAIGAVLN